MTATPDPRTSYLFHTDDARRLLDAYSRFLPSAEMDELYTGRPCVYSYLDTPDDLLLRQQMETLHIDDTAGSVAQSYVQSSVYKMAARWGTQSAIVSDDLLMPKAWLAARNANRVDFVPVRVDRSVGVLDFAGGDICLTMTAIRATKDSFVSLKSENGPNYGDAVAEAADEGELAYMDNKYDIANMERLGRLIDWSLQAGLLRPMTHMPAERVRDLPRFME